MPTGRGPFVVLDGGEGSGKTSLLQKVKEHYGDGVVITREPGGSAYAEEIRELILNSPNAKQADGETMFSLFWAARADHLKNTIIPALNSGKMVISDRFDSTTYAYQIVAQKVRELEELFWTVRGLYLKGYKPNLYVYLDVSPAVGLARKNTQRDERKNHFDERRLEFHEDLRKGFKEFFARKDYDIKSAIINAERSQEAVCAEFERIAFSLR